MLSSIENLPLRHRRGRAWSWLVSDHEEPPVPASERDPRAVRWLCLAVVVFWVAFWWVVLA